jgi:hypothetical protein
MMEILCEEIGLKSEKILEGKRGEDVVNVGEGNDG